MLKFTHNMKVLIIDQEDNMVEDPELLHMIKEKLQDEYTHFIMIQPISHQWKVTMKWEIKPLTKIQSYFMGDLFAQPSYSFDNLIYDHTEKTLKQIESELKIQELFDMNHRLRFHISKMPDDLSLLRENNVTM